MQARLERQSATLQPKNVVASDIVWVSRTQPVPAKKSAYRRRVGQRSEELGNHKYKIHGQARIDHHKYPFNCKIKNGRVKSYAYTGPNPRYRDHDQDDDSDSGLGTVLAVGAGLAIIAALATSQDGDDDSAKSSDLPVKESVLEDDCHDALQYRIRDEHNYTARVKMEKAEIEGRDLVGNAKVKYDGRHPNHATYTCHFDSHGRLMDSRYHLY